MNPDPALGVGLLAGAVTLFVIGKPRMDVVALLVLVALPLTGVLDLQQALAGFSDANVILIARIVRHRRRPGAHRHRLSPG